MLWGRKRETEVQRKYDKRVRWKEGTERSLENMGKIIGGFSRGRTYVYRVSHHLSDLHWVVFGFGYSTVCPILLGQMRVWQNGWIN